MAKRGKVYALDMEPIEASHPIEWLRGRCTVGVVVDKADAGGTIGEDVVILDVDEYDRLCGVMPLPFDATDG